MGFSPYRKKKRTKNLPKASLANCSRCCLFGSRFPQNALDKKTVTLHQTALTSKKDLGAATGVDPPPLNGNGRVERILATANIHPGSQAHYQQYIPQFWMIRLPHLKIRVDLVETYLFNRHGFWTTGATYSKGESFHLLWFGSITAYRAYGYICFGTSSSSKSAGKRSAGRGKCRNLVGCPWYLGSMDVLSTLYE